jgi:hypothetical protein
MHIPGRKSQAQLPQTYPSLLADCPTKHTHDRRRDKALLIGLEYRFSSQSIVYPKHGIVKPLSNVHRDVEALRQYLIEHLHYLPENITLMLDDGKEPSLQPTRSNIVSTQCSV